MKRKVVEYVASPYSSGDPYRVDINYRMVTAFVAERVRLGHVSVSPITYGHTLLQWAAMPGDWQFWQDFCISILSKCDRMLVLQLDGWDKSVGVAAEIAYCEANGISVEYVPVQWVDVEQEAYVPHLHDGRVWLKCADGRIIGHEQFGDDGVVVTHWTSYSCKV